MNRNALLSRWLPRRTSVFFAASFAALLSIPAVAFAGDDPLNGLWKGTITGDKLTDEPDLEAWTEIGTRLRVNGKLYALDHNGTALTTPKTPPTFTDALDGEIGTETLALTFNAGGATASDDTISGTFGGKAVKLTRDTAVKPPIELKLPGGKPFRVFLIDDLAPTANRDRESYCKLDKKQVSAFMKSCVLYKSGSWTHKYMKGATKTDQQAAFDKMIADCDGLVTNPRLIIGEKQFSDAVKAQLKDPTLAGLALSNFAMYFTTAAGRAVRIPITSDSKAYFITDRASRSAKLGLCVMDTPAHGPLASTFGRQLLDLAGMPATDDAPFARSMMEILCKSDASSATKLSGTGRSALTDWFAVMAIEDYRGVAFANPGLGWGYDMTNVQFYGLVARALAHPELKDSGGKPVIGQVIVGTELKPGDGSYADVLNSGGDMQEYPDMAQLKTLATSFLQDQHPDVVKAVKDAFSLVPEAELDDRAKSDIFHLVCANLYDSQERIAKLTGKDADKAVEAVCAALETLKTDSAGFEAYVLAHGITKSNDPAPRSTGF